MIKNHICRIHKLEGNKLEGWSVGAALCVSCSEILTGGTAQPGSHRRPGPFQGLCLDATNHLSVINPELVIMQIAIDFPGPGSEIEGCSHYSRQLRAGHALLNLPHLSC